MDKLFSVSKDCQIAFRFTPTEEQSSLWTIDKVLQALKTYDKYVCAIVCYEQEAERPHYQGYFCMSESEKDVNQKRSRSWFVKTFKPKTTSDYSWVRVKNSRDYKKYIVKEGMFTCHNYDPKELIRYQTISYPKKKHFQEEVDELEMQYFESSMSGEQYIFEFMKLKGKYRQAINTRYIQQRLLMLIARKDEDRLREIARVVYSDLNLV